MAKTYQALKENAALAGSKLDELPWCSKCRTHVSKLEAHVVAETALSVVHGINSAQITLICKDCNLSFNYEFAQRIESLFCVRCRNMVV